MKFTQKEIEKFNKEVEFGEKCLVNKKYETMIFNLLDKYVKPNKNKYIEFTQLLEFLKIIKEETNYFEDLEEEIGGFWTTFEYLSLLSEDSEYWDCFLPTLSKNILNVKKYVGENFENLLWFWNGDVYNTFWDIKSFKKVLKEYFEECRYQYNLGD